MARRYWPIRTLDWLGRYLDLQTLGAWLWNFIKTAGCQGFGMNYLDGWQSLHPIVQVLVSMVVFCLLFWFFAWLRGLVNLLRREGREGYAALGADEFGSDLDALSLSLETFSGALHDMAQSFALRHDITPPMLWHGRMERASFPVDEATTDPGMMQFAQEVYSPMAPDGSPGSLWRNSRLVEHLTEGDYRGFHGARRALSQFLTRWYRRLGPERAYATRELSVPSTVRAIKNLTYLEMALAAVMKNPSPLEASPDWYKWATEICVDGEG